MKIFENHFLIKYIIAPLFRVFDYIIPKNENFWGFSVHPIKSDQFIENSRAVFEAVKLNKEIKKILFTRDTTQEFFIEETENFQIISLKSFQGLLLLAKCKVLFVSNSISMEYCFRYQKTKFEVNKLNLDKRLVINLWHGISVKKLFTISNQLVKEKTERVKYRKFERQKYRGLICSSDVDSYAMAAMFYPIKYNNIWQTGLPRNDFLLKDYVDLPLFLRNQINILRKIKEKKKLVLYAPTYRQTAAVINAEYYQFDENEIIELKKVLKRHNAILGIRLHYFRNDNKLFNIENFIDNEFIYDIGHNVIQELAPVVREADLVVSDYSSVFVESLYLDKPVISFAYDFEEYKEKQDGLLYDFEMIFPGDIVNNTKKLFISIDDCLGRLDNEKSEKYNFSKAFFYKYMDTNNSMRVVEMVQKELHDK